MTAESPDPPLATLDRPDAARPILLSGLAAAGLFDGSGEMVLARETRGGMIEWGGPYAQGVRLTGPWHLRFGPEGRVYTLAATLSRLEAGRAWLRSRHATPELEVEQEAFVLPGEPAVGRRLTFRSRSAAPTTVRVVSEFAPFLAPVLVEGVKPYRYELATRGGALEARSHGFGLRLESDPLPHRLSVNGAPWIGGRLAGEIGPVAAEYELALPSNAPATLNWVIWGGLDRTFDEHPETGGTALAQAARWAAACAEEWRLWTAGTPQMSFPDDPRLEAAYALARDALRALYTAPDGEIMGLVAGFPWYAALWCRDLAWMLPAVLWLGDEPWFEGSLRCVYRFQAGAHLPLLGAEAGELPMQVSPGPIFLYGTSDTTLYYPDLLRRLVDHTGRLEAARPFESHVARALAWAAAKCSPSSGLIRNGGEVVEMREATAEHGSTHYGFDAVDTTIWDSTDRRDHAIDVQVLYYAALRAAERIARIEGRVPDGAAHGAAASALAATIRTRYAWPSEGYLYDSLREDGTPVARVRPNALRAVSAGLFDPPGAAGIVERALRDDLTTPWGVRTLASTDPGFRPTAYHDGQVWTIATAWAADAAFAAGADDRGFAQLHRIADRILEEGGLANECYRGDRAEPFNSCFLLGFSIAPFLTALFERLWGITLLGPEATVRLDPRFPTTWKEASLRGVRFRGGRLDIAWRPDGLTVGWTGPSPITVVTAAGSATVRPGAPARLPLGRAQGS